jgi:long-chain acyl-CoA synthetase
MREVYDIIAGHVEETNRQIAAEPMMAGGQIKRFLILHKELDADDGELTRTQKVRRGFIAERYQPLVDALYTGKTEQFIATEVTFEDGRKGSISATLRIMDAKTFPPAQDNASAAGRASGKAA